MSKPEDIPDDVVEAVVRALGAAGVAVSDDTVGEGSVVEVPLTAIARAILAERERCADLVATECYDYEEAQRLPDLIRTGDAV